MDVEHRNETYRSAQLERQPLLPLLTPQTRDFIGAIAQRLHLSYQDVRAVAQAARDLQMWRERPLEQWWARQEDALSLTGRERKKELLRRLREYLESLARQEKRYPAEGLQAPTPRRQVRLRPDTSDRTLLGRCPVYSDRTVCCGLYTLDMVLGCAFGCSYCTIQTFYGDEARLPSDLASRLQQVHLEPDRFYHIGTGQSSDSLVWGNRSGMLDALCDFAERHPRILLELKTKSDNVRHLLQRPLPPNLVCSWTLNTDAVIRNEEHRTATLDRRLDAARRIADTGLKVAFHFHPMVFCSGWRDDYAAVAQRLIARFDAREVAFLSMGTMTFIRPVAQQIRRRGGATKVLQMPTANDPHGKLTYPDQVKTEMYRNLYGALRPWHDDVFIYLCMEKDAIWYGAFGWCYPTNDAFEQDFERRWLAGVERHNDK